ncbi:hypothetical protein BDY17DRAFT_304546 [Neohortaea acidophila]|uniref:Uncharacterized protein n=1 Tax=Neohortaea acidophila TaxID=245834 RepID=A0A6A6PIK9_9PEZI|nr:uncharacterized protein BDY17DRAFT_304546 [Neohortaea acidophila]KAF2479755.1 hypothetical protein BDY17DRAFT_304546 [Neohortaea acidophila]
MRRPSKEALSFTYKSSPYIPPIETNHPSSSPIPPPNKQLPPKTISTMKSLFITLLALASTPLIQAALGTCNSENHCTGCGVSGGTANCANCYICECNSGELLKSIYHNIATGSVWTPIENCPKNGNELQCVNGYCTS